MPKRKKGRKVSKPDTQLTVDTGKNDEKMAAYAKVIEKRISTGFYTLQRNPLGKRKIWDMFHWIMKSENSQLEGWIYCLKCKHVLLFARKNYAYISKHSCYLELMVTKEETEVKNNADCADGSVQNEQTNGNEIQMEANVIEENLSQSLNVININDNEEEILEALPANTTIATAVVPIDLCNSGFDDIHMQEAKKLFKSWIVEDCRPLSILKDRQLPKIFAFVARMGSIYGYNSKFRNLIPNYEIMSKELQEFTAISKRQNQMLIKDILNNCNNISITLTYWYDSYVEKGFLTITLHYEKDLKLAYIILGIKSFGGHKNLCFLVHQKLSNIFHEYGIDNYESLPLVINNNELLDRILENKLIINCSCQMFCVVLNNAINETNGLMNLINSCKELKKKYKDVLLLASSESQYQTNSNENWLEYYVMFDVIHKNWTMLQKLQTEHPIDSFNIDIAQIAHLIAIFQGFVKIYKRLQSTSTPTLCYVIPAINKIYEICKSAVGNEHKAIETFKVNILKYIRIHWENRLSIYHKVALFLFPPAIQIHRGNDLLNDIKEVCIEMLKQQATTSIPRENLLNISHTIDLQRPAKNVVEIKFFFPELELTTNEQPESIEAEIDRYLNERIEVSNFMELCWWKMKASTYPRLFNLAMRVLSIPASCSASESLKHLAGNLLTDKKNHFECEQVENILLLTSKADLTDD